MRVRLSAALSAFLAVSATPLAGALAADCKNTGDFGAFLAGIRKEAAAQGISNGTIASALDGMAFAPDIVARDRKQGAFSLNFLEFAGKLVPKYRIDKGAQLIKKHAATFARIEADFGVPAPVLVAFWGLETDFGGFMGDLPTIRSLATLAYDCRRPELFRPELLAALKLIDGGDLTLDEMKGAWAGEIGQVQFLPSYYVQHAIDYDGDGRRDTIRSTEDALGSAANYLKNLGWQAGQPWIEEVRVPDELDWQEADLAVEHPRSQWAAWGVTRPGGKPLKADATPTSLLLPMGRNGPAFLAYPNFRAYLKWNESLVYSLTAAYYATRLAGAPAVSAGRGEVPPFGYREILDLQKLLVARGHDVGKIDGKLGALSRAAVKAEQLRLGLPADAYPSPELVARLRGG